MRKDQRPKHCVLYLASLTRDEIANLCSMVVGPGEADDTAPRMALQALTLSAANADAVQRRRLLCDVLSAELATERPVAVKQFFPAATSVDWRMKRSCPASVRWSETTNWR